MKKILTILMLALTALFSTSAFAQQRKAPNVVFSSADGKTYDLSKYTGKVVVVNFWATWCGPCRKEIPDFIEVYKNYKNKGVEILGVSLDQDGWQAVTPFVKQNNINYPVVLGNGEVAGKFSNFNAIPTTFIIDKRGNIVDEHTGVMTKSQLEAKLKRLLSPAS
jgi:cytochrome c biogenesis protein CcmG/thiol:disulfide interchange protein DsbE